MVTVEVEYKLALRKITGKKTEEIEAADPSLNGLMNELVFRYGSTLREELLTDEENIRPHAKILINGRDVRFLRKLETELKSGDTVAIWLAVR